MNDLLEILGKIQKANLVAEIYIIFLFGTIIFSFFMGAAITCVMAISLVK